jgi:hypothetical protein
MVGQLPKPLTGDPRHLPRKIRLLTRGGGAVDIAAFSIWPDTESEIDKHHTEAFRDLDPPICDCESMAKIAAQMVFARDDGTNREMLFAVAHVSEMLTALKKNYYAAWYD